MQKKTKYKTKTHTIQNMEQLFLSPFSFFMPRTNPKEEKEEKEEEQVEEKEEDPIETKEFILYLKTKNGPYLDINKETKEVMHALDDLDKEPTLFKIKSKIWREHGVVIISSNDDDIVIETMNCNYRLLTGFTIKNEHLCFSDGRMLSLGLNMSVEKMQLKLLFAFDRHFTVAPVICELPPLAPMLK